jgi:acyl-CoA synthetase (AMP-forming)/AMP-acid ligase II
MILESKEEPLLIDSWQRLLAERSKSKDLWLIQPNSSVAGEDATQLSYGDLYEFSTRIAGTLWKHGVREGGTVVLALDNGAEFCLSFFAALLLGAVPVPFPPPYAMPVRSAFRERLSQVVRHCAARHVITNREILKCFENCVPPEVSVIAYDLLSTDASAAMSDLPARPQSDLAVIQYTSGTNGASRAVELTHGNLLHNVNGIVRGLNGPNQDSVVVCWLPMFHDMGLIASMLAATYAGARLVLMTPREFILRPESWLWAISRFRGTISAAPNFAYQFCLDRVRDEKLVGLDLGAWTAVLTGAESVSADVVSGFERRFREYGLPSSCTMPVYGLAENTVACSFPARGRGAYFDTVSQHSLQRHESATKASKGVVATRQIAAVGAPLSGQRVRIMTGHGDASEREVGEIQIGGPCVMRAYHRDPRATFAAKGSDGWLRTGDRGYVADGQLFVLGRLGDVIKRAGSRYDASDLVAAAHHVDGLQGRVAAFGIPNTEAGRESIVILAESEIQDPEASLDLESALRQIVYERIGVRPDVVRLVKRGTLPRTTSGKVSNKAARTAFIETNELPE